MNDADLNPPERREFTESELKEAREELAELIVAGRKIDGLDILACLDEECDHDTVSFLGDLDTLFRALRENRTLPYACDQYLYRLAMKHLSEDAVRERAGENAKENA